MSERVFPFTTPSNYTYDSDKIEVVTDAPTDFTEDFNDDTGITFDSDKIEIVGGVNAALKLQSNAGQTFNEDFADDTDFSYDSYVTEFTGGLMRQKDTRPANATSHATFTSDINLSWGDGTLTGTATGGASVSGGKLVLTSSDVRYVSYDADSNADSQQTGCIRLKVTPDYTGNPAGARTFINICRADSDSRNMIYIQHKTNGDIQIQFTDNSYAQILLFTAAWSPTASTEYEFELNWDITTGATRLFIDGTQLGSTDTNTGTRSADIALLRLGSDCFGSDSSDFKIDDFMYFSTVQHTSNYTPAAYSSDYIYDSDFVTLPTMTYSGAGSIQAWTNIVSTEANTPRYIMNGQYYSGGWVASSDTWATASPLSTVLANIDTLPAADTMIIDIVWNGSNSTQMSVSDLTLTYTGQIYSTANDTIDIDTTIVSSDPLYAITSLNSFTETSTVTGSDEIKYTLSTDGGTTYQYWTGSAWATSSGYATANTIEEINAGIGSLTLTVGGITIKIYLHSADGTTTPSIGNLVVNYGDYIGGIAILKNLETVTNYTEDFNDADGLTFNATYVEISSGAVTMKEVSTGAQTYDEDFADDTGFTYNGSNTEFSGGQAQQVDQTPAAATCFASYNSNINLDWGDGTTTGTATGGASVSGGVLDLTSDDVRYVDYDADSNADSQQVGCIRFKVTPNYSGTPGATKCFFTIAKADADTDNEIQISHLSGTGNLRALIRDSTGAAIITMTHSWSPTSGTTYEIELNWDITTGDSELFLDGTSVATNATTGTRDANIALLRIGSNTAGAFLSNFSIDDVAVFNAVQHTSNYDIDATGFYYGDVITLPTFNGFVSAFTSFSTTDSAVNDSPRYIVDGQYWTGAAWAASSNTWATASSESDINSNIATLTAVEGDLVVKMVTRYSYVQMYCTALQVGYTGSTYMTANPYTVDLDTPITATVTSQSISGANSFTPTETNTANTEVRYVLSDDGGSTYKYWTGSAWATSSGFAQSNTASDINVNIPTFPLNNNGIKIRAYLETTVLYERPQLGNLVVSYDDYIYSIDNPTIYPVSTLTVDTLSFASSITESGSNVIKFVVNMEGVDRYWDGAAWSPSSGYTQSNTSAEINSNISSLDVSEGETVYVKAYLHSVNGSDTPYIDSITLTYTDADAKVCTISGVLLTADGQPIANKIVKATINDASFIVDRNLYAIDDVITATSASDGTFSMDLIWSSEFEESGVTYTFTIKTARGTDYVIEDVTVPDLDAIDWNVLAGY